jgi:hypothetical protein
LTAASVNLQSLDHQSANQILNDQIARSSILGVRQMPCRNLRAPAATLELGVDITPEQTHAGTRTVVDVARVGRRTFRVNEVELAGGGAVEAMHRSSVF